MMDDKIIKDRIRKELWEILKRNKVTENYYCDAVELAKNSGLCSFFNRRTKERKKFGESLTQQIAVAFPEMDTAHGLKGPFHEVGVYSDAFNLSNRDESMLQISIQKDRATVKKFGKLLVGNKLPFAIYQLIRKHKMRIEIDLFKIKVLGDLC